MLLSLHVNQDFLLFGFSVWVLGVFCGNFLIFTIAKNAKLIIKYAHINLSLMMSPPVDRSQNEKKFVKTKPQRTSKPKLTF